MAASNLKSVSFSLRFFVRELTKVGWNSGSMVDVAAHFYISTYVWTKNHFPEGLWRKAHFYDISTRCGAKDLPSFKKCTALNILFIYDCLVIGFGTSFFSIALVFPSHSISDLSHISFICCYHYVILPVDSIVQYNSSLSLPICLSIHLSYLSIYSHPSLPFLISQTSVAHCYVHMCWCATFIFANIRVIPLTCLLFTIFCWLIDIPFSVFHIRFFLPITQL